MELVLPMYNVHPYFPTKIWAKKCSLTSQNMVWVASLNTVLKTLETPYLELP